MTWVTTCKGKRGSFVLRVRIEHIDAGNGFHIGTGTWRFSAGRVRTQGSPEGQSRERLGRKWIRALSERRDGFLTMP